MNRPELDPAASAVKATLRSLRTRNGLREERLATTAVSLMPLERLEPVARLQATGVDRLTAIVEVVRQAARQLPATHRLIVDVVLALGLISMDAESQLYADDLDTRRTALLNEWEQAHRALNVSPAPPEPAARTLRLEREDIALDLLAEALVAGAPRQAAARRTAAALPGKPIPAVVVGAAVRDLFFSLRDWPTDINTTVQSLSSARHNGGKGLNQATQLARLGSPVRLVAAIAKDAGADEIRYFLDEQGIDVSTLETQPQAVTPNTLVLSVKGSYFHAGSRQRNEAALSERFILTDQVQTALRQAEVVLLTLEPSVDVIRTVLKSLVAQDDRPVTILTASPPLEEGSLTGQELSSVDYLVGTESELRKLGSLSTYQEPSLKAAVSGLHTLGVKTICALGDGTYRVYVDGKVAFESTLRASGHPLEEAVDESGATDSFASALAARLIRVDRPTADRTADKDDFNFAWHALLATRAQPGTSPSLPIEADVRRMEKIMTSTGDLAD
jgi:ribokinase